MSPHRQVSLAGARRVAAATLLLVAVAACGGGGGGNSGPTQPGQQQQGTLVLTVPTPSVTLTVGGSGLVAVVVTRGGSFSGTVSFSVSGLPSGVTGSFVPASIDAPVTAAVLSLSAAATATTGTASITITASGSGVSSQTVPVQLIVAPPAVTIALSPASLSVTAGQSATTTVNITRGGGFSGAVTLSLQGAPAGVTGTFNASPTSAATSVLTLSAVTTVAAGSYNLVVGATASSSSATASLALTVAAGGPQGFTVAVDPVEMELPAGRGWTGSGIVSITRMNGFTGQANVTIGSLGAFAFIGASPATIAPSETATNTLGLALDNAPPGVYSGTVRVSAPGYADQTAPIRLRVSAPSTGSLTWRFCRGDRVPRYFAVKDGPNGTWRHIVPGGPAAATAANPATYSFDITQSTAVVAMVWLGEKTSASPLIQGHNWSVYYLTRQEIIDQAAEECVRNRDINSRTATASLTGYQSFDAVLASVGRYGLASPGSTGPLTTTISMQNLPPGPFDLLVTRSNFSAGGTNPIVVQSLVLRRGLNPASGGALTPIDFASAEGTVPVAPAVTFGNVNGEPFFTTATFITLDGLNGPMSASSTLGSTTRPWYGVPSAKLIAGDLHELVATTNATASRRQVITYARNPASQTINFGPSLSGPSVTTVPATPWVVRVTGVLPAEYALRASMYLRESIADPRTMTIVASRGWLGGGSVYDVSVPDLSAATGFTAFWNLRRGAPVRWTVTGGEGDPGGPNETWCMLSGICPVKAVDGATYKSAQATGTVTIP